MGESNKKCLDCGSMALPNRVRCEIHLRSMMEYQKIIRLKRLDSNMCSRCGKLQKLLGLTYCLLCKEMYQEKYKKEQNKFQTLDKIRRQKDKDAVFMAYGNKCYCCGETTKEFLSIDHINGGGNKHRKEISGHIYSWIRQNEFPIYFRLLCFNCNLSLGNYGYCPHEMELKVLTFV